MFTPLDAELYVKLSPLTDTDHQYVIRCRNNPIQRFKVSFNTQLNTIASYVLTRMGGQNLQHTTNNSASFNANYLNYNNMPNNYNGSSISSPMNSSLKVTLSVQRLGSFVSVPLSITISDLMMMASMNDEALLFYSFTQPTPPRAIPTSPTNVNQIPYEHNYYTNQIYPKTPKQQHYQAVQLTPPSQIHSVLNSPAPSPPQIYSPSMMYSSPSAANSPQQRSYYANQNYQQNTSSFSSPPATKYLESTSPNWAEVPTSPSCTLFHTGISMYTDSFGTMPPSFGLNPSSNSFSNLSSLSLYGEEQSTESIKLKQSLEAMIHRSSHVNTC